MTMHTLILIVLWSLATIFTLATLTIVFILGYVSNRDSHNLALVYVKTGLRVGKPYTAKLHTSSKRGTIYKYGNKAILVPSSYEIVYHNRKRMLFVDRLGQVIASPFGKDKPLSANEREDLIYELIESHIGADGVRALKGKNTLSVILIAIIALVIGVVATFGVIQFQKTMELKQAKTTQETPAAKIPADSTPPARRSIQYNAAYRQAA